jgi:hypothetical protein
VPAAIAPDPSASRVARFYAVFCLRRRLRLHLNRYLQRYLAYAELGSRAALEDTLAHVFNDSGYRTAWARLLPADQAVLRALAQGVSDLHSLPARKRLGEELGLCKAAPLGTPKNALRLQKEELVMKLEYGHCQIQDERFVEWLRQLELEE